jgi:hypothetical protein
MGDVAAVRGSWLLGIVGAALLVAAQVGVAAAAPGNLVAVGCGANCGEARVYDARGAAAGGLGRLAAVLRPFGDRFKGGVRVAMGDIDGDGQADVIVGAGRRGAPRVIVYDGAELLQGNVVTLADFFAFDPAFHGGVFVAAGKLETGPGLQVVVGAGAGGGGEVRVFRIAGGAATQIAGPLGSFFAFDPGFRGGVRVAAANFAASPGLDQVVAGTGHRGGPHVKVFSADGTSCGFMAFDGGFRHGVYVAAGNVAHADQASLIAGTGPNGGPHVKVFDITSTATCDRVEVASFFAYGGRHRGGVRVGVADPMAAFDQTTPGGPMPRALLASPGPHGRGRERVKVYVMFPGQSEFTEIAFQGFTPFSEKHRGGDEDDEMVAAAKGSGHDGDDDNGGGHGGPGGSDDQDGPEGDDDDVPDEGRDDPEPPFGIYVTP